MSGKKLVEQLLASLDELELNIMAAEKSLRSASMPSWVYERLETYRQIVSKQRALAAKLNALSARDFNELFSTLNRINTLSTLIFNDSEDLINALTKTDKDPASRKDYIYC